MIALAILAVLLGQVYAWLAGPGGGWVPDPYAVLVAFIGLHGRRGLLVSGIAILGWSRALTLAEPVGGHLLATCAAVLLLVSQRDGLDLRSGGTLLIAAFVAALTLITSGALLRWLSGAPLTASWALLLGALLALPLAVPARRLARRMRRAPT